MNFKVLGPLFVGSDSGVQYAPTAPKPRQLLALLTLNANQVVSTAMCVDELWGSRPPLRAVSTVQTYIMQIRRALRSIPNESDAPDARLHTRHQGYQLVVARDEFDLLRFMDQVFTARQHLAAENHARSAALLRGALRSWEEPALVDIQAGPLISMHLARLHELRFNTLEQRIESELRIGMHHELIGELLGLVKEYPAHENLHAQLIVALHRSGRRAQALQAYRNLRQVLVEELGLEPSVRTEALHRAVLTEDPILDLPRSQSHAPVRSLDLLDDTALSAAH